MASEALVSILIPAYNSEIWLSSTIQSAIDQSWNNKEIIIVDDGSTDNTFNIAKKFESKSVKVVTQKNSGACVARNHALSISQGDFIQWLDSDDLLHKDKIKTQLESANIAHNAKVLHSCAWGRFYYDINKAKFESNILWQDLQPIDWLICNLEQGYFIHPAAWLVSRKITDSAGPWNESLLKNQDGEYFSRVVAGSELVNFHSDAICYYRRGILSSVSSNRSIKALESLSQANNLCVDLLLKLENSERTRNACIKFLQRFVHKNYYTNADCISKNKKRIIELGGVVNPPSTSLRFRLVKMFVGVERAIRIKLHFWNTEIVLRRSWEKFISTFH